MILDSFKLDGHVALVSGGGTRLGHDLAIALAEAGADVALLYRSDIDATRKAITPLGRRCLGVQLDLAKATVTQLQGAVQQVINMLSHLDILVNCEGVAQVTPVLDYAEKDWDEALRVNLKASFFLAQAAAVHFRERRRGKVINVGSMLSPEGGILNAAYTSSKSALLGLTHLLASEWAPLGINVNCIIPGFMVDPSAGSPGPADSAKALAERIPAGRLGSPTDLQGALVYLAGSASDYVHGATLIVDGGWSVR